MNTEIDVLVYVMTYNHEKTIEQCLDSIFSQVTSFSMLVAICDDVSKDSNRMIINRYKEKYKEKCILVYEKEDQMALGNYNFHVKNLQKLPKAKYISLAEGDDYFTDDNKLQEQYDAMEANADCAACFHLTSLYNEIEKENFADIPNLIMNKHNGNKYEAEDLIKRNLIEGNIFSYNAYFLRGNYLYTENLDTVFWNCWSGDLALFLFYMLKGNAYVIPKVMSVKRLYNEGSYSLESKGQTQEYGNMIRRIKQNITQLEEFNLMTYWKFNDFCTYRITMDEIQVIKNMLQIKGKMVYAGYKGTIYLDEKSKKAVMRFNCIRSLLITNSKINFFWDYRILIHNLKKAKIICERLYDI